jgi:hypothetical protein
VSAHTPKDRGTQRDFLVTRGIFRWHGPLDWRGSAGYRRVGPDRFAKVYLEPRGQVDHYPGIRVEIIEGAVGKVDSAYFSFDEYLERKPPRSPQHESAGLEVISYVAWDWHVREPKTTATIVEAIEAYVRMWTLPDGET